MAGRRARHRRQRGGTDTALRRPHPLRPDGFHLNGFQHRPAGSRPAASPASAAATAHCSAQALAALACSVCWCCCSACRVSHERLPALPSAPWRYLLAAFLCLALGERLACVQLLRGYRPVLLGRRYPLYLPLTVRSLARAWASSRRPTHRELLSSRPALSAPAAGDQRPRRTIEHRLDRRRVAPRGHARSALHAQAVGLLQPGNPPGQPLRSSSLTQMGVFGMFYGLHGGYWDADAEGWPAAGAHGYSGSRTTSSGSMPRNVSAIRPSTERVRQPAPPGPARAG